MLSAKYLCRGAAGTLPGSRLVREGGRVRRRKVAEQGGGGEDYNVLGQEITQLQNKRMKLLFYKAVTLSLQPLKGTTGAFFFVC